MSGFTTASVLQRILEDRCVDPELLKLLSEEEQELLFRKIRREQMRDWTAREKKYEDDCQRNPPPPRKPKIGFHMGEDGNPWVWVFGDYPGDLSYDELIAKRELEEREKEAQSTRKAAEKLARRESMIMEESESGPAPAFARTESQVAVASGESKHMKLWKKAVDNTTLLVEKMSDSDRAAYQKRRADELYEKMLHSQEVSKKRAADVIMDLIVQWKKSEERAKSYEERHKQTFLKARELEKAHAEEAILSHLPEEKKQFFISKMCQKSTVPAKTVDAMTKIFSMKKAKSSSSPRPGNLMEAERWFRDVEVPKGTGMESDGTTSLWFHGLIDRNEAERRLASEPVGCFLIRISDKVWGFSASVTTLSGVKHFVISVKYRTGCYTFIGRGQGEFGSLDDLIQFYRINPITKEGREFLAFPREQTEADVASIKTLYTGNDDDDYEPRHITMC